MASEQQSVPVSASQKEFTLLLRQWSGGSKEALDQLMPLLYSQLHRLAASCLRAERPDHTLRATALVHEAYLQLVDSKIDWQNRLHFYAVAAKVLRHVLVDYARATTRQKRGGRAEKLSLDEAVLVGPGMSPQVLELEDALRRSAGGSRRDARQHWHIVPCARLLR